MNTVKVEDRICANCNGPVVWSITEGVYRHDDSEEGLKGPGRFCPKWGYPVTVKQKAAYARNLTYEKERVNMATGPIPNWSSLSDEERAASNKPKVTMATELAKNLSVGAVGFSNRTVQCLLRLAKVPIVTLGDLADKTEGELLSIQNFGQGCLDEVKTVLFDNGLYLRETPVEEETKEETVTVEPATGATMVLPLEEPKSRRRFSEEAKEKMKKAQQKRWRKFYKARDAKQTTITVKKAKPTKVKAAKRGTMKGYKYPKGEHHMAKKAKALWKSLGLDEKMMESLTYYERSKRVDEARRKEKIFGKAQKIKDVATSQEPRVEAQTKSPEKVANDFVDKLTNLFGPQKERDKLSLDKETAIHVKKSFIIGRLFSKVLAELDAIFEGDPTVDESIIDKDQILFTVGKLLADRSSNRREARKFQRDLLKRQQKEYASQLKDEQAKEDLKEAADRVMDAQKTSHPFYRSRQEPIRFSYEDLFREWKRG